MSFPSPAVRLDVYQDFLIENMMSYIDTVQDPNQVLNTRAFIQAQADKWLTDRESGIINANTPAPTWVVYAHHQSGFNGITDEELNDLSKEIVSESTGCGCQLCQNGWNHSENESVEEDPVEPTG